MAITKRQTGTEAVLSDEDRRMLLEGPWAIGRVLTDIPMKRHDELVALWEVHRAEIVASLPKGTKPWFDDRIAWVNLIRGLGGDP